MKRFDFKNNSGRFIPCLNSSNCCIQCWSFPPPAKKKTTPFFSDQNPGRNWKKGYDILPTHIWHMGMKCHKAMKFSDPGTWANSTVFHMWMSDIYVGFVARCSMLQECCWFNLWMGQNLLLPYAWKHAKNSWKWCLVPQLKPQPFFSSPHIYDLPSL